MKIKLISAVSINGAIGKGQELLWHIKEDLKHYKDYTLNKVLIVGANTYDNLPLAAKKNRLYLVIDSTSGKELTYSNFVSGNTENLDFVRGFKSPEEAIEFADIILNLDEVIIVGGAMVYKTAIKYADECEITWVNKMYEDADKFFPIEELLRYMTCVYDSGYQKSECGINYKYCTYKR